MPVYEYECKKCEKVFEVQQRMSDVPLEECPECHGEVKKIMSLTSFQLKGGGWYADGYASSGDASKSSSKPAPSCNASCSAGGTCPAAAAS